MIFIDDIAVYICHHSFLYLLRCISQSRQIKETQKPRNGKLIICNRKLIIIY